MALKYYHTVNGELIGETSSAGVRTDYLTDSIGSVTATVDSTATVVNTYRYKPYGSQLAKTGVGADPKFGWMGSKGFCLSSAVGTLYARTTSLLPPRGVSSKGRRYSIFPADPVLGCVYMDSYRKEEKCGESQYSAFFSGSGGVEGERYAVVQEIRTEACYMYCDGVPKVPAKNCEANVSWVFDGQAFCQREYFWEAWLFRVVDGKFDFTADNGIGSADYFRQVSQGDCSAGEATITGKALVVTYAEFEKMGFTKGATPCAPSYSTLQKPPNWNPAKATLSRTAITIHSCCCDGKEFLDCPKGMNLPTMLFVEHPCKAYGK